MSRTRLILSTVGLAILIVGASIALPAEKPSQQAVASHNPKHDTDCTGHETQGRCADKCPLDTPQGKYTLIGFDDQTGAAICKFHYYDECPHAASYAATDPMCAKLSDQQPHGTDSPVPTNDGK